MRLPGVPELPITKRLPPPRAPLSSSDSEIAKRAERAIDKILNPKKDRHR